MANLLADVKLETVDGQQVDAKTLEGKRVALYFSAVWCPDCKPVTPQLKMFYEEVNEDENQLQVVYVSSDKSAEEMKSYMKEAHGSWLTVAYDDPMREGLKSKYGYFAGAEQAARPEVERRFGIPCLTVIDKDGTETVLPEKALEAVTKTGPQAFEGWP
eukprot:CAMPEP_0117538624 /NCGR_PEP_ID=MMETSP0784-20121206/42574_1 /TAXON_ID=39447 /ORGANISM="" /LENGTH=158 /DNA_ID=CAMNT_0005335243 /DNA_START=65 /DNA_END=541 /DNA_ORIENTATION=+